MVQAKVNRGYRFDSPLSQLAIGRQVITGLTDNAAIFPSPPVTVAAFKTLTDNYEKKILAADDGGRASMLAMKNHGPVWMEAADKLANYVESIANGDLVIIGKSGFHHTKTEKHKLEAPVQMTISATGSGPGRVKISSRTKTNAYGIAAFAHAEGAHKVQFVQHGPHQINVIVDGEMVGAILLTTKHRGEFEQLPRRKNGMFQMVGFNAAGMGPMSNTIEDITIP